MNKDKIVVTVRGGVAYCDNPQVVIVDYDDMDADNRPLSEDCEAGIHFCGNATCECACHER
jgi:hypothetical protein